MDKRIAFIYLQNNLSTVPCLMSSITLLSLSGYPIDIFTFENKKYLKKRLPDTNVRIYSFHGYYGKNLFLLISSILLSMISIMLHIIWSRKHYKLLIGVHLPGLTIATVISKLSGIPFIYYNLELYFFKEMKKWSWKFCKLVEKWCSRRSQLLITLDKWHVKLLSKENGISINKMVALPNSQLGKAVSVKGDYLRQKYKIRSKTKIVFTMGSRFYDSKYLNDVLQSLSKWPDNCLLVVHSGTLRINNGCHSLIRTYPNVVLSNEFIPYERLLNLFSSSNIGLVLYHNENRPAGGRNQTYIGLSSGQFNLFLKCGVPCITSPQPTFRWIFKRYKCGIALSSFTLIDEAIDKILSDYDSYRSEAVRCYNDLLQFEKYFPQIENKFL